MGVDPYTSGLINDRPSFEHRPIRTAVVAVLEAHRRGRGLKLIPQRTRCIRRGEIHELLVTNEGDAVPGSQVDTVASVAFVEFQAGGVIVEGDGVFHGETLVGFVVGFDETHCPNHMNIVFRSAEPKSGRELGLRLDAEIEFRAAEATTKEET